MPKKQDVCRNRPHIVICRAAHDLPSYGAASKISGSNHCFTFSIQRSEITIQNYSNLLVDCNLVVIRQPLSLSFLLTIHLIIDPVMCFRIMAEVPTKPQTRHADRIIVHKNTHKHTLEYMEVEKQIAKKVGIFHHSSFSLTSIVYQLKQLLSYTMHRTTLLLLQYPLSALFSADCQEQRFWIATILRHLLF